MPIEIPDTPPAVLCLSAGDATAGGGLASDVLTLGSMGCHPLPVQTAALVRDTRGIDEVWPAEPELLVLQTRTVLEDIPVRAFKLGFCGSVENIAAIAEILSDYPEVPLVVEPALHAALLLGDAGDEIAVALAELILPQTTLLVADRRELCMLAGVADDDDMDEGAGEGAEEDAEEDDGGVPAGAGELDEALARLFGAGAEFILLTGGSEHGPQCIDTLFSDAGVVRTDAWPRLSGRFLGAGATLGAAAAAALAHGMALPEAVREAQEFTQQTLRHAYRVGMGRALPDRFFWARGKDDEDA
ncbi:bifunctional hydroxymethylpyrimidine kinase/phosphomethylpyrimidine kinase [Thauera aromatica]|uniref:bifunctional hydroxymethylpyrimidine kinase/phosphomethylpyrimidine kinase n=1 Tax=Thauera aromatica TaxID=59405 RepID=UPI001FFD9E68|nr:bifunctional hydroxymethylpyrimidine kinase/phosphomethylpyrimidine kinase [Thauera aromatica]MCK2096469.1 hydroxymethylpyrimidine/phosphomethylpyrimidine kinase [Thauera aromatica]